jgi:hypothetical protein
MSQQKQSIKNELHTKINYKKIRPDEFTFIKNNQFANITTKNSFKLKKT